MHVYTLQDNYVVLYNMIIS